MAYERSELTRDFHNVRDYFRAHQSGTAPGEENRTNFVIALLKVRHAPDGLVDLKTLPDDLAREIRICAHLVREGPTPVPTSPPIIELGDGMQELFQLYENLVLSIGPSPAIASAVPHGELVRFFCERLDEHGSPRDVERALDMLLAFHETYGESLQEQAKALGGVKLVAENRKGAFDDEPLRTLALFADTQFVQEPVISTLDPLRGYSAIALAAANAAYLLNLSPLTKACLVQPPIVPLDFSAIRKKPSLDAEAQNRRDTEEAWKRVEALTPHFDHPHGKPWWGLAEHRRPLWRLQHLIQVTEVLGAEPLILEPYSQKLYGLFCESVSESLVHFSRLSPESLAAYKALQSKEHFAWLGNIPIGAVPVLLNTQEHLAFRAHLETHLKVLHTASLSDMDTVTREISYALSKLVQEYDASMENLAKKFTPKYAGLVAKGAAGILIAGTVAVIVPFLGPSFDAVARHAIDGATALSLLGKTAGEYLKTYIEHQTEKSHARQSLLGVLAKAYRQGSSSG